MNNRNVTFDDLVGLHLDWASLLVLGVKSDVVAELLKQEYIVHGNEVHCWGHRSPVKATVHKSPNGTRIDFGGKTALRALPYLEATLLLCNVRKLLCDYQVNLSRIDWALQVEDRSLDQLVRLAEGCGFGPGAPSEPTYIASPSGRCAYRYRSEAVELETMRGRRACSTDRWTVATYEAATESGLPVTRTEVREQFASRKFPVGLLPSVSAETLTYLRLVDPSLEWLGSSGVERQESREEAARRVMVRAVTMLYKVAYVIEDGRLLPAVGVVSARNAVHEMAMVATEGDVDEALRRWPALAERYAHVGQEAGVSSLGENQQSFFVDGHYRIE